MKPTLRNFVECRRGVIAIEFAMFLPIMLILWLGVIEFGSAHLAARKVEIAAQSIADLIAQHDTIDSTDLPDYANAINEMISPFPPASVGYEIISVVADASDNTSVSWYYPSAASAPTVPAEAEPLVIGGDSVIVVTVTYTHVPWVGLRYVVGDIPVSETMFARPRLVSEIVCTGSCPGP